MVQLLVVEDDPGIRVALTRALTERGHAVTSAPTAAAALTDITATPPDLVVLDLGLPDMDGLQLLRMVRAITTVPVIVATARDDEPAVVMTLDAGADDYVIKPFSAAQLDARIRAVLRRIATDDDGPVRVGGLRIDARARTATLDGADLILTPKEFDLLVYLAERPGEVVPRRELLTQVWQQPASGTDKTVDVHVSWLRRKLGETAREPRYLHSVRGVGVKLVDPDTGVR